MSQCSGGAACGWNPLSPKLGDFQRQNRVLQGWCGIAKVSPGFRVWGYEVLRTPVQLPELDVTTPQGVDAESLKPADETAAST